MTVQWFDLWPIHDGNNTNIYFYICIFIFTLLFLYYYFINIVCGFFPPDPTMVFKLGYRHIDLGTHTVHNVKGCRLYYGPSDMELNAHLQNEVLYSMLKFIASSKPIFKDQVFWYVFMSIFVRPLKIFFTFIRYSTIEAILIG